jgi:uncharacterized protein (TIGR03067 family)
MRLTNAILLLAAIGFIAADEPKKDDAEAFKGSWTVASFKVGKQATPADEIKNLKLNFDGKLYTSKIGEQVDEEGSYTLDPSKTPKTIDFEIKKGRDEGKKQLGIYNLEGTKLTMILGFPGATERPKSLKPEPSDGIIEVVLERSKP